MQILSLALVIAYDSLVNTDIISIRAQCGASEISTSMPIVRFSISERLLRTAKKVSIMLVVAAIVALIPIAHFLLFPLAMVAVVVMGMLSFRAEAMLTEHVMPCPSCHQQIKIHARTLKPLMTDVCESCHRELVLVVK